MRKKEKIKILKSYLEKLMELINFLETSNFPKKELQVELIQDLRIDAYNLEKLIELLENKKKKK